MSKLITKLLTKFDQWLDFFPAFIIGLVIGQAYFFILLPSISKLFLIILTPYLIPLVCFRVSTYFAPLKEGAIYLGVEGYQPWNATFKMQLIFYTFPFLERVLIILGLYSAWLRLWGSKIGKNILWTARTEITDRSAVEIGDNCFFGHQAILVSHVVQIKKGKILLFYRRIRIGSNAFVGAWSRIGPGAVVDDHTKIPAGTDISVNQRVSNKDYGIEDEHELQVFFSRT